MLPDFGICCRELGVLKVTSFLLAQFLLCHFAYDHRMEYYCRPNPSTKRFYYSLSEHSFLLTSYHLRDLSSDVKEIFFRKCVATIDIFLAPTGNGTSDIYVLNV